MKTQQQLIKFVKALVAHESNAVDVESGLCRFCDRVVEAYEQDDIQGHKPTCPWRRVRELLGAA